MQVWGLVHTYHQSFRYFIFLNFKYDKLDDTDMKENKLLHIANVSISVMFV